jgi:putative NADH-flavin reductase
MERRTSTTSTIESGRTGPEANHRPSIAVIGSTGRTGRLVLEEGLRRDYSMTAFTRRPSELAGVSGLRAVVHGDGRNLADVQRAVRGQDAVIFIVGASGRGPTTVVSDAMTALLEAMREAGVRRLVAVSASAIAGRRPWIAINLVRWMLRKPYEDLARMERLVAESRLDWTIVRPPYLSNRRATGRVRRQTGRADLAHGPYHITRADLAATLLDLAADSQNIGDVVLVSERKESQNAN